MSSSFPNDWKIWEVNSEPWSEVTWSRTPCFTKTWWRNSLVILGVVTLSVVGMEMSCLLAWLTMLRIAVCLLDARRCLMRLKEIECQGWGRLVVVR